jgi:NAD(P)-dependent dehydrogenase (short-subunit alcohol dehydrogenase family)
MTIQDKVVVITGGAKGIGRYNARLFAAQGAKLAIADFDSMATVTKEIEALEAEVLPIPTDLRDEEQVRGFMEEVNAHYGRIDVVINNGGIVPHFQWGLPHWDPIRDMDLSFFENVMRTNLFGTFLCTKHAIPYMEEQGGGHIINLGQGTLKPETRTDNIGSCVYAVSKLAIRAFTAKVAIEERDHNICIVSMGPGGSAASGAGAENRRGIATEEAPAEARARMMSVADVVGDRYLLAAEAPMELSGNQIAVEDGKLVAAPD